MNTKFIYFISMIIQATGVLLIVLSASYLTNKGWFDVQSLISIVRAKNEANTAILTMGLSQYLLAFDAKRNLGRSVVLKSLLVVVLLAVLAVLFSLLSALQSVAVIATFVNQIQRVVFAKSKRKILFAVVTTMPQILLFLVIIILERDVIISYIWIFITVSYLISTVLTIRPFLFEIVNGDFTFEFSMNVLKNAVIYILNISFIYLLYWVIKYTDLGENIISDMSVFLLVLSVVLLPLTFMSPLLIVESEERIYFFLRTYLLPLSILGIVLSYVANIYLEYWALSKEYAWHFHVSILLFLCSEVIYRIKSVFLIKNNAWNFLLFWSIVRVTLVFTLTYFNLYLYSLLIFIISLVLNEVVRKHFP